ncbi:MAG: hypothetical protein ACPGN3_13510, partial [Opitutales bacterium]
NGALSPANYWCILTANRHGYTLVSRILDENTTTGTSLEIEGGSEATFENSFYVGHSTGEAGILEIGDSLTVVTTNANVRLGEDGTATVEMDDDAIWNHTSGSFDLGDETGHVDFSLDDGATLNVSGTLMIADNGTADVSLLDESSIEADDITLGDGTGTGTLTVNEGTLVLANGTITVGDGASGENGTGTLTLENKSELDSYGDLYIGNYGTGTVTFNDSDWDDKTGSGIPDIYLGFRADGQGVLNLYNTAEVTVERLYAAYNGTGQIIVNNSSFTIPDDTSSRFYLGYNDGATGTLSVENGSTFAYQDTTDNTAYIGREGVGTMTITGSGSSATFASSLTIGNTATATGSSLTVESGASFAGTELILDNSTSLSIDGADTEFVLAGTLSFGSNETVALTDGATFKALGISGDFTNTSGTFSPGASPAAVTVTGNYTQQSGATLILEIGGELSGTEYDVLSITGNATLAGTLQIDLIDGYSPSGGETFVLLSYSSLTDNGVSVSLPSLSSGLKWETSWGPDYLALSVGYSADLPGFRTLWGLSSDGSDDWLDWSDNDYPNILYYLFGLGDPRESFVDYLSYGDGSPTSGVPTLVHESDGSYTFSFTRRKNETGYTYTCLGTSDLTGTWTDVTSPTAEFHPISSYTEDIDGVYEIQHYNFDDSSAPMGFFWVEVSEIVAE